MTDTTQKSQRGISLRDFGIFGYEDVEPIIFASLVTGDPLLLIGPCGTGKTQLLNTLSEALELEHRHYNASLISFDDLVGFPFPSKDNTAIEYLRTPATVWDAESVLIDEISRCKPEHQNRLFSVIQERRIQGLPLERLRYRWAAMNPYSRDSASSDSYIGAEPLDQALADRFPFIVQVPDWADLNEETQLAILRQRDFSIAAETASRFAELLETWCAEFTKAIESVSDGVYDYCRVVANEFASIGIRLSPRRVRQLVRNLTAACVVEGVSEDEDTFRLALEWSLPQRAWDEAPSAETVRAIHRTAWDATLKTGPDKWLTNFHLQRSLERKLAYLIEHCPDKDTGTLAVTQLLALETKERAAAFAFATYAAALEGRLPIGAEAISDLGVLATEVMNIDGEILQPVGGYRTPGVDPRIRLQQVLQKLKGSRRERAAQFLNYLWFKNIFPSNPHIIEQELAECVRYLGSHTKKNEI